MGSRQWMAIAHCPFPIAFISLAMPAIGVTSEIGALRGVLVHTPGLELEAVTPGNREDFLYDDLIGLEVSVREHARLKAVLCRFAPVHEIGDLLADYRNASPPHHESGRMFGSVATGSMSPVSGLTRSSVWPSEP